MSTIELTDEAMSLVQQEAARRGVPIDEIVDEAVKRSIVGDDLRRLLDEFSADDAVDPDALSEIAARQMVSEELAAVRRTSRTEH